MSQKDLIANKQAIRLINSQETITPTERKTLLQFKGNGSIARDIDQEYSDLLEENGVGITNTTTSFATPWQIVKLMWSILEEMGFTSGRILEPAAHIGRFMEGQSSNHRSNSEWVLVEPDAVAHKISSKLHPDA